MATDLSKFGRPPVTPFHQAVRAQRVLITKVDDTTYEFVIPDITRSQKFTGDGPAGMLAGDIVYAIPTVQGDWFLLDPTRIVLL